MTGNSVLQLMSYCRRHHSFIRFVPLIFFFFGLNYHFITDTSSAKRWGASLIPQNNLAQKTINFDKINVGLRYPILIWKKKKAFEFSRKIYTKSTWLYGTLWEYLILYYNIIIITIIIVRCNSKLENISFFFKS